MGWTYWADLLNIKLSPNILLGVQSRYWLKNGHVQAQTISLSINRHSTQGGEGQLLEEVDG